MSGYKGLYTQRLSDGTIHSVQVTDLSGQSIPLDPRTYIERKIKPPIEELPDIGSYPKREISPAILTLADWCNGKKLPKEALLLMQQFGFVFPDNNGILKLTPQGKQTLREHGLA